MMARSSESCMMADFTLVSAVSAEARSAQRRWLRQVNGIAQADALHGEVVPLGVNRHVETGAGEQAEPLKSWWLRINIGAQLGEIRLVQAAVPVGLGHVLGENGQLAHAVEAWQSS